MIKVKYAFLVENGHHIVLNSAFKKSLEIMNNERLIKPLSIMMYRNNFFVNNVNRIVSEMISSGILQQLHTYSMWYLHRPVDDEIVDPRKVLSLSDLEFWFVIWLPWCFVAILVFVFELWSKTLRRTFRNLANKVAELVNFVRVLQATMTRYHDRW